MFPCNSPLNVNVEIGTILFLDIFDPTLAEKERDLRPIRAFTEASLHLPKKTLHFTQTPVF